MVNISSLTVHQTRFNCSQNLADSVVISKVNGVLWDLDRPLEENCTLELLKFDDPEAQAVFWHSSAHILGEAMERIYGGCLCYGPPIESGFYYDMHLEDKGVRFKIAVNTWSVQKVLRILNFHRLRVFDFRFFLSVMFVLKSLNYAGKFGHFERSVNF